MNECFYRDATRGWGDRARTLTPERGAPPAELMNKKLYHRNKKNSVEILNIFSILKTKTNFQLVSMNEGFYRGATRGWGDRARTLTPERGHPLLN